MLSELELAYIKRQKWLARLQAVETVKALSEAMGGSKGAQGTQGTGKPYNEVGLDTLMGTMGTTWQ